MREAQNYTLRDHLHKAHSQTVLSAISEGLTDRQTKQLELQLDFLSVCLNVPVQPTLKGSLHITLQVVACAPVTKRARVQSPVGKSFLGEVFLGFFLTCKTNVRKL